MSSRGLMDKASDFGSGDCGFESHRGWVCFSWNLFNFWQNQWSDHSQAPQAWVPWPPGKKRTIPIFKHRGNAIRQTYILPARYYQYLLKLMGGRRAGQGMESKVQVGGGTWRRRPGKISVGDSEGVGRWSSCRNATWRNESWNLCRELPIGA
jgi:hypothetical protein